MSRITSLSLRNRLIVGLTTMIVAVFGLIATGMLNQELLPSTRTPGTYLAATLPDASPDVVEESVTIPLEQALSAVPEVDSVTTTTSSGEVWATVMWSFNADSERVMQAVRAAVDGAKPLLPQQAEVEVFSASMDDVPVVQFAVSGPEGDAELGTRVDSVLVPALQGVSGVQRVDVTGQQEEQVQLTFRAADVAAHRIDTAVVAPTLQAAGLVTAAGQSLADGRELAVEVGNPLATVEEIAATPIEGEKGAVPLSDIADVALAPAAQTAISRVNGQPALTVAVVKDRTANIVSVSHGVATVLDEVGPQLGSDVEFSVLFDQAPYIEQSIHDLSVEGGLGLLFAVLVILAFLGSFRSTIVAGLSIPLSLLITMIALWLGDYTLNILTLGALTVAVGRVVDDSIVVIENIRRRQGDGELTVPDIVASVRQVAGAITASTLTTVAVFLPIVFVQGIAGELFRPFSVTVSIALLASLVVALTVVPTLSYWFLRRRPRPLSEKRQAAADARAEAWEARQSARAERRRERAQAKLDRKNARREERGLAPLPAARTESLLAPAAAGEGATPVDGLQRAFLPTIRAALRRPGRTIALSVVLVIITAVLMSNLQTDFLGDEGANTISVDQALPLGTTLEESDAAAGRLEQVLETDPEVIDYVATVVAATGAQENRISVTLDDGADSVVAVERLQRAFDELPDAEDLPGIGEVDVYGASGGIGGDVTIELTGDDLEALATAADNLTTEVAELDGVTGARNDLAAEQPVIHVTVDRAAAAKVGYDQARVGQAVQLALSGAPVGSVTLQGAERQVVIRPSNPGATPEQIAALPLPVSAVQRQQAQKAAQNELTRIQEERAVQQIAEAEDAYEEQLREVRAARDRAADDLNALYAQLRALQQAPLMPPPGAEPSPDEVLVAERNAQLDALQEAIAAAEQGLQQADEQIAEMIEQHAAQSADRAESDALAERLEAIADITGEPITVSAIATVTEELTQPTITRADGTRQVTVFATPASGQLGLVSANVDALVASTDLPDGVSFAVAGASAEMEESFAQLGIAMLLAILLVLLIMIATFHSVMQPLVLLVSIPFAATGAAVLLVLTNTPLGIPAMIGLLMLIGIVVTNAIVLIDLINKLREQGMPLEEAVLHGTRLRLRPILMTAAATVFALLPMAFGLTGGGIFISQPLAIVVIGGLITSTLMTLVLVPVLYTLVERRASRRARRRLIRRRARAVYAGG